MHLGTRSIPPPRRKACADLSDGECAARSSNVAHDPLYLELAIIDPDVCTLDVVDGVSISLSVLWFVAGDREQLNRYSVASAVPARDPSCDGLHLVVRGPQRIVSVRRLAYLDTNAVEHRPNGRILHQAPEHQRGLARDRCEVEASFSPLDQHL